MIGQKDFAGQRLTRQVQTDRHADRQTDRTTDRQTDRKTDKKRWHHAMASNTNLSNNLEVVT